MIPAVSRAFAASLVDCNNFYVFQEFLTSIKREPPPFGPVMGAKDGLNPEVMLAAISAGSGRNSATESKFPAAVLTRSFDYGAEMHILMKDIDLAVAQGEELGGRCGCAMIPAVSRAFGFRTARFFRRDSVSFYNGQEFRFDVAASCRRMRPESDPAHRGLPALARKSHAVPINLYPLGAWRQVAIVRRRACKES
jgi:hypothetical protein